MPSTIIVVRHANTFEDKDLPTRIGSRTDLSLVQSGLDQCSQIGQFLKIKGYLPAAVYSSYMTRARQTAQTVLKEMRLEREIPKPDRTANNGSILFFPKAKNPSEPQCHSGESPAEL